MMSGEKRSLPCTVWGCACQAHDDFQARRLVKAHGCKDVLQVADHRFALDVEIARISSDTAGCVRD